MSSNTDSQHSVRGFLSALTLLSIATKLTGHITWSWWWVLSPTLIPLVVAVVIIVLVAVVKGLRG